MIGLLEVKHGVTGKELLLIPELVVGAYKPDDLNYTLLYFNGGGMIQVQGEPRPLMEQVLKLKGQTNDRTN